jgi:hypothetical protein
MLKKAQAYDLAAFRCRVQGIMRGQLKRIERDAKAGALTTVQVKLLRLLASRGWGGKAQEMLAELK